MAPLLLLCAAALLLAPSAAPAAKRPPRPVVPPDLKILSVSTMPDPYVPGAGALDFRIELELPEDVTAGTLLDVTALIESPSKRSMRFLTNRQPVEAHAGMPAGQTAGKPHVSIVLSWDGLDQRRRHVASGQFSYEVRAKLLTVGDRGPRTYMTSWPKRGTIAVLEPVAQPELLP